MNMQQIEVEDEPVTEVKSEFVKRRCPSPPESLYEGIRRKIFMGKYDHQYLNDMMSPQTAREEQGLGRNIFMGNYGQQYLEDVVPPSTARDQQKYGRLFTGNTYFNRRFLRRRSYLCPKKRKYRMKLNTPCCGWKYNQKRINLCHRNWAKISVTPFVNFLRTYRRKFARNTPPTLVARCGRSEWRKMTCCKKQKYYEQAKRARIRGYKS